MTLARVLCGECGSAILVSDRSCPRCGAPVELPRDSATVVCLQCGHRQEQGGSACSACGAALPGHAAPAQPGREPRSGRGSRSRATPSRAAAATTGSARLWQVISVVAVGVLLAVLAWSELSRDSSMPAAQSAAPQQAEEMIDLAPLEQAVAENPGDVHARLRLANALQDNGVYGRAIELYKDYLETHPEDPNARVDLGICYFELARTDSIHGAAFLDRAIKEMRAAIEGTPDHQPAAFNLGIVYLTAGNLEESTRWFERAVALDSSSALGRRAGQMLQQHREISQ